MVKSYAIVLVVSVAVGSLASGCSRTVNPSHSVVATQTVQPVDLRAYILTQSQFGGKLDFFTAIKGHEHDGRQIKPGVYANGLEFALYSWGHSVKDLGIKTVEEAYEIFAEIKGQPVTPRDKSTIKLGFDDADK